ncbi:hypothetical protein AYO22_00850 [Fonsecaea multimorphosa]|nr:hypothetical protein AYO22_00850 [Fonsecaea multimorphosa]
MPLAIQTPLPPDFPPVHSCQHCEKLILVPDAESLVDRRNGEKWASFDPDLTVGEARKLAKSGCRFCEYVSSKSYRRDKCTVHYRLFGHEGKWENIQFGTYNPKDDDDDDLRYEGDIVVSALIETYELIAIPGNPASDIVSRSPINVEPGSRCPIPPTKRMPDRVISIDDGQPEFKLHLLETNGLVHPLPPYAALSYCWGGDQVIKTTNATLDQFRVEIDFKKLPTTIRHAVTTTYELGLRYLFVDAFCIIQDNDEDKQHQISQMPSIYSEASVTIIAARARNVEDGFLQNRPSSLDQLSTWKSRYENMFSMSLRCPGGKIGSAILIGRGNDRVTEPIHNRAWALQEQMLARRVLHYGQDQIIWNCWSVDELVDEAVQDDSVKQKILEQWYDLVRKYSLRKLSLPADKLLAIGAIAERVGVALHDDYLAGLWKSCLPRNLSWFVWFKKHTRPEEVRAPSWSWAAVDGEIGKFVNMGRPCELELIDCHVELLSPTAPYGAVKGGHLTIRGRLRRALLFNVPRSTAKNDYQGLCHIKEPGQEGIGSMVPICFDAVEKEFDTSDIINVAFLKAYGHKSGFCSGLVLRDLGGQRFSRLGLFGRPSRVWRTYGNIGLDGEIVEEMMEEDSGEEDSGEEDSGEEDSGEEDFGEEYSLLYRYWMEDFNEYSQVEEITII